MINGIRAFLPGSLVDIRPVKDTSPFENKALDFKVIKLDRKRNNVVVSRRAVLEESQGEVREKLLVDAVGRRRRQGHRQEHHRLRRVRRPGRHRRPAAHHRSRVASRQASVGSAGGRRRSHGQGPQVRPGKEPRLARHEAAGRRPVGRPVAPLSAGHAPLRQGHEHHRLRRVRGDRVGHRGPGPRVGNGLDQQEHPPDQGRAAGRRSRSDDPRDRRGAPPHLARHEAVHAEPVGRLRDEPQEGRQGEGHDQVDHRLRRVRRPSGRHRRPRPPVRPLVERHRRNRRARLQEGPGSRSRGAGDRRRARAHFARHQAARRRSVHQLRRHARQGQHRRPAR